MTSEAAGHQSSRPLRIVVMGTGPFAVPMFTALLAAPHEVVALVTRPDHAPPGRRPPPNPMRQAAAAAHVAVVDPEHVNAPDAVATLRGFAADLFVVCDYGQLLSAEVLGIPPLGGINLHGSLLPRHRGAAPIQWAILAGDATTGVSVIGMTPALDAGNVIAVRETPIGPTETAADLEPRLADLGAGAVLDAIERIQAAVAAGDTAARVGTPQEPAKATRAPRLSKASGVIDWSLPAPTIERMRRALEPWPRVVTFFTRADGSKQRLVLAAAAAAHPAAAHAPTTAHTPAPPGHAASIAVDATAAAAHAAAGPAAPPAATPPGTVIAAEETPAPGRILVACGAHTALAITQLVPEGKRPMTAGEFLRGSSLRPGYQLG